MRSARTPCDGDEGSSAVSSTVGDERLPAEVVPNALDAIEATFGPVKRVALRDDGSDPVPTAGPTPDSGSPPTLPIPSRYQILGEIARGGMGAVLRGRDADLNRELAIKVLLEKYTANSEVVGRVVEEAQIGGQLQHPGIVPVYDLGQFADKRPPGRSLLNRPVPPIDPPSRRP